MQIQQVQQKKYLKLKNNSRAAIASELAAKIYNLTIVSSNIEDAIHNTTRFLFMKENFEEVRMKGIDYITSFIFQVKKYTFCII